MCDAFGEAEEAVAPDEAATEDVPASKSESSSPSSSSRATGASSSSKTSLGTCTSSEGERDDGEIATTLEGGLGATESLDAVLAVLELVEGEVELPDLRKLARLEKVREMLGSAFFLRDARFGAAEALAGIALPVGGEYVDAIIVFLISEGIKLYERKYESVDCFNSAEDLEGSQRSNILSKSPNIRQKGG